MDIKEQILERKQFEEDMLSSALKGSANILMKKNIYETSDEITDNVIRDVFSYYSINIDKKITGVSDINEKIDRYSRLYGLMKRNVKLKGQWYKDLEGALIGTLKNGHLISIIPNKFSGFHYIDYENGKKVNINKNIVADISEDAISFYKTFPNRKMNLLDLIIFIMNMIKPSIYMGIIIATLFGTLIGLFLPKISKLLIDLIIPGKSVSALFGLLLFAISITISRMFIKLFNVTLIEKTNIYVDGVLQAASIARVLSLPQSFFNNYSVGELSKRIDNIRVVGSTIISIVLSTGITALFSIIYVGQVFNYTPDLFIPAIIILIITIVVMVVSSLIQIAIQREYLLAHSKSSGLVFSFINGIQKIRLAGAEKRAFAKWLVKSDDERKLVYDPPLIISINSGIMLAISLFSTILFQYIALVNQVSISDYFAFVSAYGLTSGAFMSLSQVALKLASVKPALELAKPIFDTEPENNELRPAINTLSGNININDVSFRYPKNTNYVFKKLNLQIKSGDYVAIVGKTGCGKSTLVKLLLGFEKPEHGAIYYDDIDMQKIDITSIRKNIGVVLQNGSLFYGSIFKNITLCCKDATLDKAYEAAKLACIDDDIENMPMKMMTMVSDGNAGLSGGQKQRILIARALCNKPKILIFDEATAYLDNIAQKQISDTITSLNCTRIVIAHRLSTIKNCHRIVYLEDGEIKEDGTYEELMALNGRFKELVEKQQINN